MDDYKQLISSAKPGQIVPVIREIDFEEPVDFFAKLSDYGRSKKDTGPYHFKRHWGFEPKPLHYQYYLNRLSEMPNISPANPKYRRKIEMWKKLPIWLVNLIGPQIVKYVP